MEKNSSIQSFYELQKANKPLANKTLQKAKEMEANKLNEGYKYIREGNKLVLKKITSNESNN